MRVFVTGATGFIGSAIIQDLIKSGHTVLGLARSDAAAQSLLAAGAAVHRGDLQDLDSLREGAAKADGIIHNGFIHDFSKFKQNCEIDERAIKALGSVLVGSVRPMVVTSGTALVSPGRLATEDIPPAPKSDAIPRASEQAAALLASRGVRVCSIRLAPTVHGEGDHGFIPMIIAMSREKGESAYIGDGKNRWNAVHRIDAARLFRLALEKGVTGARYHAVDEEGIAFREIAQVIGKKLKLPVVSKSADEAAGHFSWFTAFAGLDCPASSKITREQLGWKPSEVKLIADLEGGSYFRS